jgi:hypothetical protein
VTIQNSTFSNNDEGINGYDCRRCKFENITVSGNHSKGITIHTTKADPLFDVAIHQATLYGNGDNVNMPGWPVSNLSIGFKDSSNSVTLTNSILGEPSTNPTMINCYPWSRSSPSGGFSQRLIATNSIFSDATCAQTGSGNITADPLLSSMADNGGFAPTMLPLLGSPAVDAGSNAVCTAKDQRGIIRGKTQCDIGSVEAR